MRRLDEYPIDPEIAAQLDAIDATLAGDPVDPEHAELAELALLLAAARPEIDPDFSRSLDDRVQRRFAAPAGASGSTRARGRRWALKPALGVLASGIAAVVVVVVVSSGGSGGPSALSTATELSQPSSSSPASVAASHAQTATVTAAAPSAATPAPEALKADAGVGAAGAAGAASAARASLQPPANGRKIVQSAQLALTSAPNRIDAVAQEVFDVIGRENGIVNRSTVTASGGPDGYAQFQLSVPSSALSQTMSGLSRLQYANVASRTDTTQDVNNQFVSITHRLADARALRTALLKQLANAVTQPQINSLTARIHDAEASIASDEATLRGLNHQIDYSRISLTINPRALPVSHRSGSFTIGKGAHDAGRVLTVAAGVALITLAALVPVGLLAALAWWIGTAVRRRRREQALDMA
jgi:Domain of unknown function (DUF4349)